MGTSHDLAGEREPLSWRRAMLALESTRANRARFSCDTAFGKFESVKAGEDSLC